MKPYMTTASGIVLYNENDVLELQYQKRELFNIIDASFDGERINEKDWEYAMSLFPDELKR